MTTFTPAPSFGAPVAPAYAPRRRPTPVWWLTVGVLVLSALGTYAVMDQGWGDAGVAASGVILLVSLGLLTLAAQAISSGDGVGEGFVSALVTVFVLLPMAGFLFFAGSAVDALQDIGGVFDLDGSGTVGSAPSDAYLQCMTDPATTLEQCSSLAE